MAQVVMSSPHRSDPGGFRNRRENEGFAGMNDASTRFVDTLEDSVDRPQPRWVVGRRSVQ